MTANMKTTMDEGGRPMVSLPLIENTLTAQVSRFVIIHVVFSFIVPSFVMTTVLRGRLKISELKNIYKAVSEAHDNPVNTLPEYQDEDLLIRQLWKKDSARPYTEADVLEFQNREGYCSSATIRCTLKSFPGYPKEKIPPQKAEPADPEKWQGMDVWDVSADGAAKRSTNLEIFSGSCSYPEFLSGVKRGLEDPSCRVVLNYLRPVLFGFALPWWLPSNMVLALLGGHFSPIVGIVETENYQGENPLIGVFDVNHKYGGAYLVPARTLYRSMQLTDVTSQKPRAMILIHEPTKSKVVQSTGNDLAKLAEAVTAAETEDEDGEAAKQESDKKQDSAMHVIKPEAETSSEPVAIGDAGEAALAKKEDESQKLDQAPHQSDTAGSINVLESVSEQAVATKSEKKQGDSASADFEPGPTYASSPKQSSTSAPGSDGEEVPVSEAAMRQNIIDTELNGMIEEMMKSEDFEDEDEMDPESYEPLMRAAKEICYTRKIYDVSADKIVFFPSVIKTIINYDLFEKAEKYYFEEDDEYPSDYAMSLRAVAFARLAAEQEANGDADDDEMDDDMMERLSMAVQLTEDDLDELAAAVAAAEAEDEE